MTRLKPFQKHWSKGFNVWKMKPMTAGRFALTGYHLAWRKEHPQDREGHRVFRVLVEVTAGEAPAKAAHRFWLGFFLVMKPCGEGWEVLGGEDAAKGHRTLVRRLVKRYPGKLGDGWRAAARRLKEEAR